MQVVGKMCSPDGYANDLRETKESSWREVLHYLYAPRRTFKGRIGAGWIGWLDQIEASSPVFFPRLA